MPELGEWNEAITRMKPSSRAIPPLLLKRKNEHPYVRFLSLAKLYI